MDLVVTIVGRPNVGKSTLFNRLVGRQLSLVHSQPGVTRDWCEGYTVIDGMNLTIIDTAGLEEITKEKTLASRLDAQTKKVIALADIILMVVDARVGITPLDRYFTALLRKSAVPMVLIANKCEDLVKQKPSLLESSSLGLGDPILLSAEHGYGLTHLAEVLTTFRDSVKTSFTQKEQEPTINQQSRRRRWLLSSLAIAESPLALAIAGRPNVGKSTLLNRLLGEERAITGPESGITRDVVTTDCVIGNKYLRLLDTTGIRRNPHVVDSLEKLAIVRSTQAISHSQIVILLLDGSSDTILGRQELTIARKVLDKGRGLVIALNKWDIVTRRTVILETLRNQLVHVLSQVQCLPIAALSALTGDGIKYLLKQVFNTYSVWNMHISTAALNRWLTAATRCYAPPVNRRSGCRVRLRYVTQIGVKPPTFALFTDSQPDHLPSSYIRYLVNDLRLTFGLLGVPVRVYQRKETKDN